MGTVFSFDVRGPGDWTAAIAAAVALLHEVDQTYSTYREDSIVSALGRGLLTLDECSAEVQEVFGLCDQVSRESGGFFTSSPGGHLDPSGLVKGWAIERASTLVSSCGARDHAINGGGDMQLAGGAAPGKPWRVGISDPLQPGKLLTVVQARDVAVATSGSAERGAHIVDPHSGLPAEGLASVTVVGRSLTFVDAYATAAFAMGEAGFDWLAELDGYEAMAVRMNGTRWQTSGFASWTLP